MLIRHMDDVSNQPCTPQLLASSPPFRAVIPEFTFRSFCFTAECEIFTSRLILAPQTIPACPAALFISI